MSSLTKSKIKLLQELLSYNSTFNLATNITKAETRMINQRAVTDRTQKGEMKAQNDSVIFSLNAILAKVIFEYLRCLVFHTHQDSVAKSAFEKGYTCPTAEEIFALDRVAQSIGRNRFKKAFKATGAELRFQKLLKERFLKTRVRSQDIYPFKEREAGNSKVLVGTYVPDVLVLGYRWPNLTEKFYGVVIEIDGLAHNKKWPRDKVRELVLESLGLHLFVVENSAMYGDEGSAWNKLKLLEPIGRDAVERLKLELSCWNIATWLSLKEMDTLTEGKFDFYKQFHYLMKSTHRPRAFQEALKTLGQAETFNKILSFAEKANKCSPTRSKNFIPKTLIRKQHNDLYGEGTAAS